MFWFIHIDDTMEEILYTVSEVGMMSKMGGGTSAYFGHLREKGSEIRSGDNSSLCSLHGII